ncbi:hypothetical protein V5O48_017278 [Marasmius crinis-equi]|uniref:F-box domain-containing protein n=1 Tax=Marasmius crinis-equi TaxID=585013 RepID=A0ABR3EPF0_9AGAR
MLLESKQAGLEKAMKKYRTLLSPIHRLPSEVLLEIFQHCCHTNTLSDPQVPPALALSRVCGRWRDIAVSSPRLWSSITISQFRSRDKVEHSRRQRMTTCLTRLFLERSKNAPLKLKLRFPWDPSEVDYSNGMVMDLLGAQSKRWEELTIDETELYASSAAGDIDLPILKRLTLLTESPDSMSSSLILDRFAHCPALTSLCTDVALTAHRLSLPWANIRTLTLQGCADGEDQLFILSLCSSSVQRLTFVDVETNDWGSWEGDRILADMVTSLSLQADPWSDVDTSVVQHLTLSRLSSVDIGTKLHDQPNPFSRFARSDESVHLEELIQRSSCTITSLRLQSTMLTDVQVLSLLRLMPRLKDLDIGEYISEANNRVITHQFSNHLLVDPEDRRAPLVPHLTELKLSIHLNGLDQQALAEALKSRWLPLPPVVADVGVGCLKSVELVLISDDVESLPPGPLSALQCFRDVGLRFTISQLRTRR